MKLCVTVLYIFYITFQLMFNTTGMFQLKIDVIHRCVLCTKRQISIHQTQSCLLQT
jgi:hypothetical protein